MRYDVPRYSLLVLAFVFAQLLAPTSMAATNRSCPLRWGKPGDLLVKSARTAKAIFLAVEQDFHPSADVDHYPDITAEDEGDHWSVFRWRQPKEMPNGDMVVTAGGGQLELMIAKCDGAISDVHFSR